MENHLPPDLNSFQKDILNKLKDDLQRVFERWKRDALLAQERGNPLNDNLIPGLKKEILKTFDAYKVLGAAMLVCNLQDEAEKELEKWLVAAQRGRESNEPLNDHCIPAIRNDISLLCAGL